MTTITEIETRLTRALAVMPSEQAVHALDQRVARVMATSASAKDRRRPSARTLLRPLAVAAAFAILTGTVVGAMNLIERTVDPVPAWRTAWDRGEILGIQATDQGLTVTLERAYVDLNQVVVILTITGLEGLESPRSSGGYVTDHLIVGNASLTDPSGRSPVMGGGTDVVEPGLAASVRTFQFDPPTAGGGKYTLVITDVGFGGDGPDCVSPCAHETVAGTWSYEFALPAATGTVVSIRATDTVGSARLELTGMRITPTMVTARIAMFVDDQPVAWWAFIPRTDDVRRGDDRFSLTTGRHILVDDAEVGPEVEFSSMAGADDATGTWEIVIPAVDYGLTNGEQHQMTGPWTLTVTVP